MRTNRIAHCWKFLDRSFDQQQPFLVRFHLTLPAVNRGDVRNNVHTCGQLVFNQMMGDFVCLIFRA